MSTLLQVSLRSDSGLIQVWFRSDLGLIQIWLRSDSGLIQVWFRSYSGLIQVWNINLGQIGLKCCELSHLCIPDTEAPCLINLISCGNFFISYNCFKVGIFSSPQHCPYDWVMRIGSPVWKWKIDTDLEQKRLNHLQMVPFECPGHCNSPKYSILTVVDLL